MNEPKPFTHYSIGYDGLGEELWIRCFACGFTSFNGHDIRYRYCSKCKRRHAQGDKTP